MTKQQEAEADAKEAKAEAKADAAEAAKAAEAKPKATISDRKFTATKDDEGKDLDTGVWSMKVTVEGKDGGPPVVSEETVFGKADASERAQTDEMFKRLGYVQGARPKS